MQTIEKVAVPRQIAAVQKRDGEFQVAGVKAVAFRESPRHGTDLQAEVP